MMNTTTERYDDGIAPLEEVDLKEFVTRQEEYVGDEYARIFTDPARAEVRIYRRDQDNDGFVRTVIENVRVRENGDERPTRYHLHGMDVATLNTFLTALKCERSTAVVRWDFWPENNSHMMNKAGLTNETLTLRYETHSGRKNSVQIHNQFRSYHQRMVDF